MRASLHKATYEKRVQLAMAVLLLVLFPGGFDFGKAGVSFVVMKA